MRSRTSKALIQIFTFVTGLVFLNMSFLAAEVAMLDIKDKATVENIAKLMINGGLEEERDGESSGHDAMEREINVLAPNTLNRQLSLIQIAIRRYGDSSVSIADLHCIEVHSPPPKFSAFLQS